MTKHVPTLAAHHLRWLLVSSTLLLIAGFVTPMMTLTKFLLFSNSFSLFSGIWQLLLDGKVILFLLIASFSIILPLAKIILLFTLLSPDTYHPEQRQKYLHLMHDYGRWAMLDVMVVAILIVTVKLGAIASIEVHSGLYIFGAAVLLIMFITQQVVSMQTNHNEN
ncbi:MAG: paraquat-inducible protein A [Piscirickettsiaceae bacterium]|nr:paraquat-inducible protein A [Piscirickettsiaceae bacterium]